MVRNGFVFDVVGAILIVIGVPIMVSALGIGGLVGHADRAAEEAASAGDTASHARA